jgi:hypothetical protein
MIFIASILLILYAAFTLNVLVKISNGKLIYLLLYIIFFLPFYSVFQSLIYLYTKNEIIIDIIKFSKDIVLYFSFFIFLFGHKDSILFRKYYFSFLDKLMLFFFAYILIYLLLPVGNSTFLMKATYSKNLFLIPALYFVGRNNRLSNLNWNSIVYIFKSLILIIFSFTLIEFIFSTHFHTLINFSEYNLSINNFYPEGNYDLTWTFEKGDGSPRFAAFFSNPLALSASLLCYLSVFFSDYFFSEKKTIFYIIITSVVFYFAFSRASILAAVLIVIIFTIISKNYKLLFYSFIFLITFLFFISFYASDEFIFYIEDTFYLVDTSSLGHLFEWIQSIISIYENPLGIGLATSGNAASVVDEIKVGGENQFLIFGVQLGVVFMIIYILIILKTIINSYKTFKYSKIILNKKIGLSVFLLKIGLVIPALTSNIEIYLFVSLFAWLLAGINENSYNKIILKNGSS